MLYDTQHYRRVYSDILNGNPPGFISSGHERQGGLLIGMVVSGDILPEFPRTFSAREFL